MRSVRFILLVVILFDAATVRKIEMCKSRSRYHTLGSVHNMGVGTETAGMQCQQLIANSRHRIIGGDESDPVPWYTLLLYEKSYMEEICGASLILANNNSDYTDMLVTAAHCIADYHHSYMFVRKAKKFKAYPGIHHWSDQIKLNTPFYGVAEVYPHPNYTVTLERTPDNEPILIHHNDIGLVKLKTPVTFKNSGLCSISPAQHNEPLPVGKTCFAIGMGVYKKDPDILAPVLRKLEVEVHGHDVCQVGWGINSYSDDEMLCAGPLDESAGICDGDSGSSLYCLGDDQKTTLHGIVSMSPEDCVKAGQPAIYAQYGKYAAWVKETAKNVTDVLEML